MTPTDGIRDLGFVDDLHGFLATCRAMIAPVKTGGGVRVKLLDAIRMGLPVVGTAAAVGSLNRVLDIAVFDHEDCFVAECRRLLIDRHAAGDAGDALFLDNQAYWTAGLARQAVVALILGRDVLPDRSKSAADRDPPPHGADA
jgi:glycosyltransferase involved in cell wall biosynthesis